MIFESEAGQSLTGMVLTASPDMLDPNFNQTLVFIAEHGAEGALGLVMNRPLGRKLGEATSSDEIPDALREVSLFQGGPVKPTGLLFARFQRGSSDEQLRCEIFADPEKLIELPKSIGWMRVFVGHAGWQAGQLEAELRERAWIVRRPHPAMLEEPMPHALWHAFAGEDQRWRKLVALLPKATGLN